MARRSGKLVLIAAIALDALLTFLAFLVSYHLRLWLAASYPHMPPITTFRSYLWILAAAVIVHVSAFIRLGSYGLAEERPTRRALRDVFISSILLVLVLTVINSALKPISFSRLMTTFFILVNLLFLVFSHIVQAALHRTYGKEIYRNALLVGSLQRTRALANELKIGKVGFINVIGILVQDEQEPRLTAPLVLGTIADLREVIDKRVVDIVIFTDPFQDLRQTTSAIRSCEEVGVIVYIQADFLNGAFSRARLQQLAGLPFLALSLAPDWPHFLFIKRCIDVLLSVVLLCFLAPVFLGVALAVRFTSPGRVVFRQRRSGLNGRVFTMCKFRSMYEATKQEGTTGGPVPAPRPPKLPHDPRITPFGRLLRRFSLDELPQLWNVLKGDMSLVGPRPVPVEEVATYERWQRRRLSMKPGLTCFWQTGGRSALPFQEWMQLDLKYIDTWSLLLDLKIMLRTLPAILEGKGSY